MRQALFASLLVAGGLSLANIVLGRARWLSAPALLLLVAAVLAGGHKVPVDDFPGGTPYLGLDWFILDLLGSTVVFILIEKLLPLHRDQPVFRMGWQTDFVYFLVNHLLVGAMLMVMNFLVRRFFG